jgi:plastocyanin
MTRIRIALVTLGASALLLVVPASAGTSATRLTATVSSNTAFVITLARGTTKVRLLKAGTYTIFVRDRGSIHNFRLRGPGVNKATGVAFVGTRTWTVRLRPGRYTYLCDPHPFDMRGTFRVVA